MNRPSRILLIPFFCAALSWTFGSAATEPFSKDFSLDLDEEEADIGERLQLHSKGTLAETVDLDTLPQVKRVACAGNRLLLAMTDDTVAHDWKVGQLVVGGTRWGCNATLGGAEPSRIYVKIAQIVFPVEGRRDVSPIDMVTIHHVPAGPLDMLEEADIFFRFQPAAVEAMQSEHHYKKQERFRRSLYNLVNNLVSDVNWQANFTTSIPFDVGADSSNISVDKIAVHKAWGDKNLKITRGDTEISSIADDFVLLLDKLSANSHLAYTFDLVIKNIGGSPKIVRYISQFDVNAVLSTDATLTFSREMGLTYNTSVWESPPTELLRMPVAQTLGLPPIYLVVSVQSSVQASVQAYTSGSASLRTAYNASGFLTLSQQYDPALLKTSDYTWRAWLTQAQDQSLRSTHWTEVDVSVYQTLKFLSAISWHYHDVDMELAPPTEMIIKPTLTMKSSSWGVRHCVDSSISVEAFAEAAESRFTVQAFGMEIWDVPLQPAMSRYLHVLREPLGQECKASQCFGLSQLTPIMYRTSLGDVVRGDTTFNSLTAMSGNTVRFVDGGIGAMWCGQTGMPCYSCSAHQYDTPTDRTCSARLMTSRLATAITRLASMVSLEWPDRHLVVLEAWDEPTSHNPSGVRPVQSVFKEGRGASLGLTTSVLSQAAVPLTLSREDLERLGQLAVCSGMEYVQFRLTDDGVEVAVNEDGHHLKQEQLESEEADNRLMFWQLFFKLSVSGLYPQCLASGSLDINLLGDFESTCGSSEQPLDRTNRHHMDSLVEFEYDNGTVTFEPESRQDSWCSTDTRQCSACVTPSHSKESWDWCSTRMMAPRLVLAFRRLQKMAEQAGFGIRVLQGFSEHTQANPSSTKNIFNEGRALRLVTQPLGNETTLAKLARCSGFDFVDQATSGDVSVCIKNQYGYRGHSVSFLEGAALFVASLTGKEHIALEYETPLVNLSTEINIPFLVDGLFHLNEPVSEHFRRRDLMSRDSRYFRFDDLLLTCVELVFEDMGGDLEIVRNSAYRTRAANFLDNLDARPEEERWRYMTGQAVQLRPLSSTRPSIMLSLAKSIMRQCISLAQSQLKAVGLGCHEDFLYVDMRPLKEGREFEVVRVWDAETNYCSDVIRLQWSLIAGGPVIHGGVCENKRLEPGLEFLSFQFDQEGLCSTDGQAEFCQISHTAREAAANDLQELLTAAAGHGRLPRYEIIHDIRACLVDNCGGCPGEGPIFDAKVRACSRVVHKYLERAAAPFQDLANVTTFFNTDTAESIIHGEACSAGHVCVEETVIYSLLVPTVTRRFYPNPAHSVEKELFGLFNPSPLLELAAQELAFRTKGVVTVYIEDERDTYSLRNVLQVLFVYNNNVTMIEIHVTPEVDVELVTTSIQRKLTTWAGVACPERSRFAMTPFKVMTMDHERKKRSVEGSKKRNEAKNRLYNWEREWLDKML